MVLLALSLASALGWQAEFYQDPMYDGKRETSAVYRDGAASLSVTCAVDGKRYQRFVQVTYPDFLQSNASDIVEWRFDDDEPQSTLWRYSDKTVTLDNSLSWSADSFTKRLRTATRLIVRARDGEGATKDMLLKLPQERAWLFAVLDRCNKKAAKPL